MVHDAFLNRIIDKAIHEALKSPHPRIPSFYSLPKTHKNIEKPPGRPIISGVGAKTEKGSRLANIFLRPHVLKLQSYIIDTSDLLKKLHGVIIPMDSLFVSIDVEVLYCSIHIHMEFL